MNRPTDEWFRHMRALPKIERLRAAIMLERDALILRASVCASCHLVSEECPKTCRRSPEESPRIRFN